MGTFIYSGGALAVDNGAGVWYNGHMNMEHGANVTRMVATLPCGSNPNGHIYTV